MRRRAVCTTLAIAVLAACAPRATTPPPAPAPSGLRAGTSGNYPPFSTWQDDRAGGFAPDLLAAFTKKHDTRISWMRFAWPELLADMRGGRFDVVADGITVTPERSIAGRFTVPIARGGAVLLLHRPSWSAPGDGVAALDRQELRVVVNAGGHLERVTRTLFHAARIRTMPGNAGLHEALANGDADAAMTNTFEAPRWAEGIAGLERVGPLGRDVVALWVRTGAGDLGEELDRYLLDEEASGALAAARIATLGEGRGPATARPLPALFAATRERLSLMPAVARVKKQRGVPVTDAAQEARVIAAGVAAVEKAAAGAGRRAPSRARIEAFYRAQIEAAKDVEEAGLATDATSVTYSLEKDLRPAIARISARLAFLVVRVPAGTTYEEALAAAHEDLDDTNVDRARIEELARAVAAISE